MEPRAPDAAARAAEACHAPASRVWTVLDERLWVPLRSALEGARRAHLEAVRTSGLESEAPSDPLEARARLDGYATQVSAHALAPTLGALGAHLPARTLLKVMEEARRESLAEVAALPTEEELDHAPELGPAVTDSSSRRLGKALARALAVVRSPEPTRTVPLRALAARHRALYIAPAERRWTMRGLSAWAAWAGGLEATWSDWASTTVPLLSEAEFGEPDPERLPELWQEVAEAARALGERLGALAETAPHADAAADAGREQTTWSDALGSDLGVAGTFLTRTAGPEEPALARWTDEWMEWFEQGLARLHLHHELLSGVVEAANVRDEVAESLAEKTVAAWCPPARAAADGLDALATRLASSAPAAEQLEGVRQEADALLEAARGGRAAAGQELQLRRTADQAVEALQTRFWKLPAVVELHALPTPGEELRRPDKDRRTVRLQEMARQAFDALRMERMHAALRSLGPVVEAGSEGVAGIDEVIAFGFETALKELAQGDTGAEDRAKTLATEALQRAAAGVRSLAASVEKAAAKAVAQLDHELREGLSELAERALSEGIQDQILEARSRLTSGLTAARAWMAPRIERGTRGLRLAWARGRQLAARLVRRGRTLVGAETGPGSGVRTASLLARADALLGELPLVYQRLFAPKPVSDPSLLAGREVELAEAESRWERWSAEDGVPLLVTGQPGSGISSFFNVFVGRLTEGGAATVHHVLDRRLTTEAELAAHLAEVIGVERCPTMDALAEVVLRAPSGSLPDLVALEGLEHLYLRVPGGTDLVERLLTFMAETEPRMFWMASMATSAWQLVQKSEPTAAAQIDRIQLSPLAPEAVKAAVLSRHRRSGMPLTYTEPTEGRRLLRRRLRRLQGTEGHQTLLEADFFERLQRSAPGNMRLTLFQWLRSVDFAAESGGLAVRPLAPLDFSFLEALDLTQNFTLKAFLEHRTLTLAEHDSIFRLPRQESYQVFESLGNRHIIEAAPTDGDGDSVSEVKGTLRYRIRPLLTAAVAAHLATRNIVH